MASRLLSVFSRPAQVSRIISNRTIPFITQISFRAFSSAEPSEGTAKPSANTDILKNNPQIPTFTEDELRIMQEYAAEIKDIELQYELNQKQKQSKVGKVISIKNKKSITVKVNYMHYYPKVNMYGRRTSKIMAHDENEEANLGDIVKIIPSRPLSARKRHKLDKIISKAEISQYDATRANPLGSLPEALKMETTAPKRKSKKNAEEEKKPVEQESQ